VEVFLRYIYRGEGSFLSVSPFLIYLVVTLLSFSLLIYHTFTSGWRTMGSWSLFSSCVWFWLFLCLLGKSKLPVDIYMFLCQSIDLLVERGCTWSFPHWVVSWCDLFWLEWWYMCILLWTESLNRDGQQSTKITSHLNSLTKKKETLINMTLEVQILAWNRHENMAF
jgi:hypothetical protein